MPVRAPRTELATHRVENQPPPLCDYDLFEIDAPLREGLEREGAGWAAPHVRALARDLGSERVMELDDLGAALQPRALTIIADWKGRGGITSVVTAEWTAPAAKTPARRRR